jgi:hypothetical protein
LTHARETASCFVFPTGRKAPERALPRRVDPRISIRSAMNRSATAPSRIDQTGSGSPVLDRPELASINPNL